jgi:DNA-binding CsgD family transcriptional regulator
LNAVQPIARRELEILNSIAEGPVSQRALARRLGIALGLANLYVKRLARKGYIKITTLPPHRIKYLVTPRGLTRKTRLTYEYMRYSLALYRETRNALRRALAPLAGQEARRIALYGTGEAAELAYLTLRELAIEPVAILGDDEGDVFLGHRIRALSEIRARDYDYVVVATLDAPDRVVTRLATAGLDRTRVVTIRR